jgi:hypothetical protein
MDMPIINFETLSLSAEQMEIVKACLGRQNRLRSAKPKNNGFAAYVWRMVAFQISSNRQHHCMPMTADFDLPQEYWGRGVDGTCTESANKRREKIKELEIIVDAMVNSVPKNQWKGVIRWGQALGAL